MLCTSRMTPTISAYTYLWGQHDYNTNQFAPIGWKVQAHVTLTIGEMWAAHRITGYYVGNAGESYRCHNIYISDTRSIQICETVFFKHKYITMPLFTPADAILRATDKLTAAITGAMSCNNVTMDTVNQLLKIFKLQATAANNKLNQQCQQQPKAHTQRVLNEAPKELDELWMDLIEPQEEEINTVPRPQRVATSLPKPTVEFEEIPNPRANSRSGPPIISQDDNNYSPPAYNTRQQQTTHTLTQDCALQISEVKLDMKQVLGHKYPLQFLCN
jgi:hypothetical protein